MNFSLSLIYTILRKSNLDTIRLSHRETTILTTQIVHYVL